MPRIVQLPPLVITKIAAGEVIERPASVVKELLENSLDAGSSRIDVDVEQGGIELIRVVDDGCGIAAEDMKLAFASHATSKLSDVEDLFRISTLGFRGEALASVGSVARVTLQSLPAGAAHGTEIQCEGGQLSELRPWNGTPGTRIEVRNLFYNTPVRRKFLRTQSTELGHVSETFTRLALAHLQVHWTLRHQQKPIYELSASAGLLDRIQHFFGREIRDQLYPVEAQHGPVRLKGFVADPACDRGNSKLQYLFLNGRWIRDRSLGHALQEAYRGLLMTGRYPVAFLFLDLPPDQVDVNVHPTKAEVRFREGNAVYHLVLGAIREQLRARNLTARLLPPSTLAAPQIANEPPPWSLMAPTPPSARLPFGADVPTSTSPPPMDFSTHPAAPAPSIPATNGARAIQLYDTYLVLETAEGMLVIDQHALHERILFEQLKARLREGRMESQALLIPEPIDLPAEQASRTLEKSGELGELGIGLEAFGGDTLLLTRYPAILGQRSPVALLRAVVDHLMTRERVPQREQLFNDLLSLMACHAAVRAGDRLAPDQIVALIEQRRLAEDTHHCPHGRPTALLFSRNDLERQFGRK